MLTLTALYASIMAHLTTRTLDCYGVTSQQAAVYGSCPCPWTIARDRVRAQRHGRFSHSFGLEASYATRLSKKLSFVRQVELTGRTTKGAMSPPGRKSTQHVAGGREDTDSQCFVHEARQFFSAGRLRIAPSFVIPALTPQSVGLNAGALLETLHPFKLKIQIPKQYTTPWTRESSPI